MLPTPMLRFVVYEVLSPKKEKTRLLKMRAKSKISVSLIVRTLLSGCPSKFFLRDNLVAASTVRLAMSLLFVNSLRIVQELEEPETSLFSNINISLTSSVLCQNGIKKKKQIFEILESRIKSLFVNQFE